MTEESPLRALLASREVRGWGAYVCAILATIATAKAGYIDLSPAIALAWFLR